MTIFTEKRALVLTRHKICSLLNVHVLLLLKEIAINRFIEMCTGNAFKKWHHNAINKRPVNLK